MIELGLAKIGRLLQQTPFSWKTIHIAGTNGKGSISAYVSALLHQGDVRCGRFTSPHLIDRWDCITINERVVQKSLFDQIEDQVKFRNHSLGIKASEFEILTATAFEIFNLENVEVGVVEVGLGGRLDATNILKNVIVSVISRIGYDHQAILGDTLDKIAKEKAGIMRRDVPCVIDGTNKLVVLETLMNHAQEVGTWPVIVRPEKSSRDFPKLGQLFQELELEPHQQANLSCAVEALKQALPSVRPLTNLSLLFPAISKVRWLGRLQWVTIKDLVDGDEPILLDGAHNAQSAKVLGSYVDRKLRAGKPVTWVIAVSRGKNVRDLLQRMLRPRDNVIAVKFGRVDGMPWVKAVDTEEIKVAAQEISRSGLVQSFDGDLVDGLAMAGQVAAGGRLVIAGSLYLVSDVLRFLRDGEERVLQG